MPPLSTQLTTHPLYYFTVGLELTTKLTTILLTAILLYLSGLRGGRVPLATKLTTILLTTTLLHCQVYVEGEFLSLHLIPVPPTTIYCDTARSTWRASLRGGRVTPTTHTTYTARSTWRASSSAAAT
eukprot:scaffold17512_cov52-Phaeocystis_antarctica.AAC.2